MLRDEATATHRLGRGRQVLRGSPEGKIPRIQDLRIARSWKANEQMA